jgi:hypothetical protein
VREFWDTTDEELRQAHVALSEVLKERNSEKLKDLNVGDLVEYTDGGPKRLAKITKLSYRNVSIRDEADGSRWQVSPILLTKVDTPERSSGK